MAEPNPTGPFAEFAEPKTSAVEEFKRNLEHERQQRWERRLLLALLIVGGALGASLGEAVAAGPETQSLAFVLALVGGLVGGLVGWGVGAASWAQLAFQSRSYLPDMKPLGSALVGGNRWDRLTTWMAIWGAIGVACGTAYAAGQSPEFFSHFNRANQPPPYQWLGALCGLLGVAGLWTFIQLKRVLTALLGILVVVCLIACRLVAW
jgi:hypothetical protein